MSSTPHIIIKNDIEHIRLRPGMYIGSTYDPNHLLQEIIDNSLDELINNYASELRVNFISDRHVVVVDNGRGIPVHMIELEGGVQELSIIAASTRLKSGAKFDNDAYDHSIGLHGIGLVAVNALSKYMRISVKDKTTNIIHDIIYDNSELTAYNTFECPKDVTWSTRIEFEVAPQFFTIPSFNINKLYDQFKLTGAKFPKSQLFIDDKIIEIDSMDSFVREKLELDISIPLSHYNFKTTVPIQYYDNGKVVTGSAPADFDIYFTYEMDGPAAFKTVGDVNLRLCGGRYLTNFCTLFVNSVLDKYGSVLTKNEVLSNFRLYISTFMPNPEFDSQAKTNMSKDIKFILDRAKQNIEALVLSPFFKECINILIERKTMKKISKKTSKKKNRVSAKNPLKDCLSIPGNTFWVLEGESAAGTLMQIRDNKTEGVFPLTGKILNVVSKTMDQVADSKKFRFLFEALGVELGNKKQTNYRYDNIKILCDADPDGHHIVVLLLMAIWYYCPYFLNNGKVSIIIPPLYGAYVNKKFVPIYSAAEAAKYTNYRRYKGIGEMNADELEVVIRGGGIEYIPKPPTTKSEAEALIRCLDDTELKRRLCLERDKFDLNRMFIVPASTQQSV